MKLGTNYSDQQQTLGIAKRSNVTVWLGYRNHGYDPYASMNLSSSKEKEQDIRKSVNFLQNNLVVIDEIPLVQSPHMLPYNLLQFIFSNLAEKNRQKFSQFALNVNITR